MERNQFAPPTALVDDIARPPPLVVTYVGVTYVGFWARVGAALIDTVLLLAVSYPVLYAVYGSGYFATESKHGFVAGPADLVMTWIFPLIATILFWRFRSATPGKMVIKARIVDARTGEPLSTGRCIARYIGLIVASMPLGLGLLWVAFDRRKQGWHDKIAGSVVVRNQPAPLIFSPDKA